MSPNSSVFLPSTREEGRQRLEEFLSKGARRYADRRNHIVPGHENVSRLSTATRTRLVLETEICEAARERFSPQAIEKFEQEVWWRLYWKGWLERRPEVWSQFRSDLAEMKWFKRAEAVANGESGVAIMDHFARELVETGYLHNHARMWWASFWIHVERLPWQLGAEFFHRYLLDGDAASNTLSWRWVAGLQTRGKSYLVRRSNLERYVDTGLLSEYSAGLEKLEDPIAIELEFEELPLPRDLEVADVLPPSDEPVALWIHDEDLVLEKSPLAHLSPKALLAPLPRMIWEEQFYSPEKQDFLARALADGTARAEKHFDLLSGSPSSDDIEEALVTGAKEAGASHLVSMRPFAGPLADALPRISTRLQEEGISLHLMRRDEDLDAMSRATAGFFGFWKKTSKLREPVPI
ncbi:MAG: FAD-binding domain-containing protein [Verrucomicrobiota bacterium]